MSTVTLSGIGTYWGNTLRINGPSVSTDARTAQPDPAPNVDESKGPPAQELSSHERALLELGDTIASFGALQFRSTLYLFKSLSSGIQNPPANQVAEAYKNQMVLQK